MDISPFAYALIDCDTLCVAEWNPAFAALCRPLPERGSPVSAPGFPCGLRDLVANPEGWPLAGEPAGKHPWRPLSNCRMDGGELWGRLLHRTSDTGQLLVALKRESGWERLFSMPEVAKFLTFSPEWCF